MQDVLVIFVILLVLLTLISTLGGSVYPNDEELYMEPFVISGANIASSKSKQQQHAAVPAKEGQCKACSDEVKPINKKKAQSPQPPPPQSVAPPEPFAPEFVVEGFEGDMYAAF